ncbi:MAG: LTA synthase family protein [Bacilli bacterium]
MKIRIKKLTNKIFNSIKKYFTTNVLFITFVIFTLLIDIILRFTTVGLVVSIRPIISDMAFALFIGSIGYLIKPKNQIKYYFILTLLFSFLAIVNSIYYSFFMSYISVNLLSTLSMVGEVTGAVSSKLNLKHFIYIIFPVMLLLIHYALKKRKYYKEITALVNGKIMIKKTLLSALLLTCVLAITLRGNDISAFQKQWNREYVVQQFGIYVYTIDDLVQSLEPKFTSLFGYDEAAREFREFYSKREYYKEKNKFTNEFKGKNIIFVHMESIQSFLVDLKVNDIEITPNINRLTKEGIYFSSFYPQISVGTSADTEFTLNTGIMPSSSGTVFVNFYDREYESLEKKFKEMGYYTFSMHANNGDYWNRNLMHKSLGYDKFYSKDSFNVTKDNKIGLGLSDKEFFNQGIPIIKKISQDNKNFFGTVITLTNHSPFSDPKAFGDLNWSKTVDVVDNGVTTQKVVPYLEGTEMGNYLKSAHYADEALGQLINQLRSEGILDNTVIALYGDHEARMNKKQFDYLYNYDLLTENIKDKEDPTYISFDNYKSELMKNTPFIIYNGTKNYNLEVKNVMGMYDVMPTIANMFGFDFKYALGNDIFSKSEKIVIFPNGNFLTNKVYYNSLRDEYILLTNEPIESDYIERLKKYTVERLDISKGIVEHNLIKNEKEKLEVSIHETK